MSNYPPGVTGSEPEIVGYPDDEPDEPQPISPSVPEDVARGDYYVRPRMPAAPEDAPRIATAFYLRSIARSLAEISGMMFHEHEQHAHHEPEQREAVGLTVRVQSVNGELIYEGTEHFIADSTYTVTLGRDWHKEEPGEFAEV